MVVDWTGGIVGMYDGLSQCPLTFVPGVNTPQYEYVVAHRNANCWLACDPALNAAVNVAFVTLVVTPFGVPGAEGNNGPY